MWSLKDKYVYWLISSRNGPFLLPQFLQFCYISNSNEEGYFTCGHIGLVQRTISLILQFQHIANMRPEPGLTIRSSRCLSLGHHAFKMSCSILQNEERSLRGAYTPQNNLRGFILRCNCSCPYSPWPYSMLKTHGTSRMPFPFLRITTTLSVSVIP